MRFYHRNSMQLSSVLTTQRNKSVAIATPIAKHQLDARRRLPYETDTEGSYNPLSSRFHKLHYPQKTDRAYTPNLACARLPELLAFLASGTAVELPCNGADFPLTSGFDDLSSHLFSERNKDVFDQMTMTTTARQTRC